MIMEAFLRALLGSTLLGIILKATAAMLIASVLGVLARSRPAAVRHLIGAALFGFLLLLPLGVGELVVEVEGVKKMKCYYGVSRGNVAVQITRLMESTA